MRTYRCRYCGKEFDNIHALAGHIRMSHSSRKKKRRRSNNMLSVPQGSSASSTSSASLTWEFKDGSKWIIRASPKIIEFLKDIPGVFVSDTEVVKYLKKHGLCTLTIIKPEEAKK